MKDKGVNVPFGLPAKSVEEVRHLHWRSQIPHRSRTLLTPQPHVP
jgi:hypothetical protein